MFRDLWQKPGSEATGAIARGLVLACRILASRMKWDGKITNYVRLLIRCSATPWNIFFDCALDAWTRCRGRVTRRSICERGALQSRIFVYATSSARRGVSPRGFFVRHVSTGDCHFLRGKLASECARAKEIHLKCADRLPTAVLSISRSAASVRVSVRGCVYPAIVCWRWLTIN